MWEGRVTIIHGYSLVFQAIERFIKSDVIPFNGCNLIVAHPSKGIDQVSTQTRVNVVGLVFPKAWSVLAPVGEVA